MNKENFRPGLFQTIWSDLFPYPGTSETLSYWEKMLADPNTQETAQMMIAVAFGGLKERHQIILRQKYAFFEGDTPLSLAEIADITPRMDGNETAPPTISRARAQQLKEEAIRSWKNNLKEMMGIPKIRRSQS